MSEDTQKKKTFSVKITINPIKIDAKPTLPVNKYKKDNRANKAAKKVQPFVPPVVPKEPVKPRPKETFVFIRKPEPPRYSKTYNGKTPALRPSISPRKHVPTVVQKPPTPFPKYSWSAFPSKSPKFVPHKFRMIRKPIPAPKPSLVPRINSLQTKIISINGIKYKATRNKLTRKTSLSNVPSEPLLPGTSSAKNVVKSTKNPTPMKDGYHVVIRGVRYVMGPRGGYLEHVPSGLGVHGNIVPNRLHLGGYTYTKIKPGYLVKSNAANVRTLCTKAVKTSINRLLLKNRKKISKNCMFYCKYGKCNKEGSCPFVHDPDKIAICTRFMRGTCHGDCKFSHKLSPDKIPACTFFLKGVCVKDNCPYRHVNVGPNAEICPDFLKLGHCSHHEKCDKLHVSTCPEYDAKGECSTKDCRLQHKPSKAKKRKSSIKKSPRRRSVALVETPDFIPLAASMERRASEVKELPKKSKTPVDYDSDDTWDDSNSSEEDALTLKLDILPRFLIQKFNLA